MLISFIHRLEKQRSERLSNIPQIMQLAGGGNKIWICLTLSILCPGSGVTFCKQGSPTWGLSCLLCKRRGWTGVGQRGPIYLTPLQLSWVPTKAQMCVLDPTVFEASLPTAFIFVRRYSVTLTTALQHLPLSPTAKSRIAMEDRYSQDLEWSAVDSESFPNGPQAWVRMVTLAKRTRL